MQIANISGAVVRFTEKSGKVVEIEPGKAEPVDIDKDNPFLVARERANLVKVGGSEAQARKAARERTPVAPADTLTE
jgi:hypothetical protein